MHLWCFREIPIIEVQGCKILGARCSYTTDTKGKGSVADREENTSRSNACSSTPEAVLKRVIFSAHATHLTDMHNSTPARIL